MALFNVTATMTTTIVVVADDEDHARQVGQESAKQAFEDMDEPVRTQVTGHITHLRHLRNGWNGDSIPYGSNSNECLSELLPQEE